MNATAKVAPVTDGVTHPVAEMMMGGLTVLRAENDTQLAMAVQRPRNELAVFQGAVMELELAPEFARRAWYSIPYKDGDGTVYVEGPSIKAAMALARRWGNCANSFRIVDDNDERITVEGVFLDFETNMRTLRTVSIPKKAWSKKTNQMYPLRGDRLNTAVQAGGSKAVRNAILASLPQSLVDTYIKSAKEIATGTGKKATPGAEPVDKRIENAIAVFVKMGATKAAVDSYISGLASESAEEVLQNLLGVHNALTDKQTTIEEVFPKNTGGTPEKASGQVPSIGELL